MREEKTYNDSQEREALLIQAESEGKRLIVDTTDDEAYGVEQPIVELDERGEAVVVLPTKILTRKRHTLTFTDEPKLPEPISRSPQESLRYLLERIEEHEARLENIEKTAGV
jgi:hypothetical protein